MSTVENDASAYTDEYDPLMGGGPDHDFADSGDRPKYELCPAGNFSAVCVLIWDLGTHMETFQNQDKPVPCRNIIIGWEVSKKKEDGTPHVILERYGLFKNGFQTFSDPRSKLRKLIEGWNGVKLSDEQLKQGVPIRKILGQACLLAVTHRDSKNKKGETTTYHEFGSVSPLPEGMSELAPVNPPTIWLTNNYRTVGLPMIEWVPQWYGENLRDISWNSDEIFKIRIEDGEESNDIEKWKSSYEAREAPGKARTAVAGAPESKPTTATQTASQTATQPARKPIF